MSCSYYDDARCRSCTWLPRAYAEQLRDKELQCKALLQAYPQLEWLPPVASPEWGFRNKAKMVVGGSVDALTLGILDAEYAGIDLRGCPLYPPALAAAFDPVAEFLQRARVVPYHVGSRRGEAKYVLATVAEDSGELMLRVVLRSTEALERMQRQLPWLQAQLPGLRVLSANIQPVPAAVLEGEREIVLTAADSLTMLVNGLPLHLRPRSFFQTNSTVAAALYRQARDWAAERAPASAWDLYCGVGGFALHLAAEGRTVTGVEASTEAIASAERSRDEMRLGVSDARRPVGTGPLRPDTAPGTLRQDTAPDTPRQEIAPDTHPQVHFVAADALEFVRRATVFPELVVVNPPRRGIGRELAQWLDASAVDTVLYSSCNAASLASDLAAMPQLRPRRARVLDMFPHTPHYEVLVELDRDAPAPASGQPS